eukprot:COSAG02_NODE_2467_length_8767_cov_226.095870_7_plen_68_part_00
MEEHWSEEWESIDEHCGFTNALSHTLGGDDLRICTIAGNVNGAITVCEYGCAERERERDREREVQER